MTTPDEFLRRVLATVDDLALLLSHTPRERQEEWLQGFEDRVRRQWRAVFSPFVSGDDVDGMVADAVERVRKRRDEIENRGGGMPETFEAEKPAVGSPTHEIEVTPAMIEAGFRVYQASGITDGPMEADKPVLVEIFEAMYRHRSVADGRAKKHYKDVRISRTFQ